MTSRHIKQGADRFVIHRAIWFPKMLQNRRSLTWVAKQIQTHRRYVLRDNSGSGGHNESSKH